MKPPLRSSARTEPLRLLLGALILSQAILPRLSGQVLLNIDFGAGQASPKTGFAATGQSTNDYWNLYRHYDPKFTPGMPLVAEGELAALKLADGTVTPVRVAVTNAPGVWGNATGDPMYDTYLFSQNGSNITVTLFALEPGRYHFYLYGHADPDVAGEQNSQFTLQSATNRLGPITTLGSAGWKTADPWEERYQYVVFRDVEVLAGQPVVLEVAPGHNGVPVLNGVQIISRGTSPPRLRAGGPEPPPDLQTNLMFRSVHYDGKLSDHEARFTVDLEVESLSTNTISGPLFDGDVAVLVPAMPKGLRIVSQGKEYRLWAEQPGAYRVKLDLVAKIHRAEPWNQIQFTGPPAAIASVTARASDPGVEIQLLNGTPIALARARPADAPLQGYLGVNRQLSLRWQSKTAEITRKSLVNVDTRAEVQITPTVIKFTTALGCEILQAGIERLEIALPAGHALTRVQGEQIRDWQVRSEAPRPRLVVEFVKPIEKSYTLTLNTEQAIETLPIQAPLEVPQPLDIQRESGSVTLVAEDMLVDIETFTGLRQVNARAQALAAFQFYGRPFNLTTRLRRIEPSLLVTDRITVRLEETRLLVSHRLGLTVEKAGIYALELSPQPEFTVTDVRMEGLEDWTVADGKLRVTLSNRLLGKEELEVELERAYPAFPEQVTVTALPVAGALVQKAQIGAGAALGIQIKTAGELRDLREIPITALPEPSGELLAYTSDSADWSLNLAAAQLPGRIVAEVFNLVTIGDGLVGGSATIRFGLIQQGAQTFQIKLPAHWQNVDFIGPNIRRKERQDTSPDPAGTNSETNAVRWTITLQDKTWDGYTLVITYDYPFDPKQDSLDLRGAHVVGAERETGSVAVTTAASLELQPQPITEPLHPIDQMELTEADRAVISRPVLLAYRYTGAAFLLTLDVTRHEELAVLNAVADRTQITSVLTEEGQMLTQASFMVKNNDKQFQKFQLPAGATLWACYVDNQPAKAETDGDWLLVPLLRAANRNEAFAVDLVYKQTFDPLKSRLFPETLRLAAPKTDVPNTYAEWHIYAPESQRLSGFAGNMTVARGTTYQLRDAWERCLEVYLRLIRQAGWMIVPLALLVLLAAGLLLAARQKGWRGVVTVLCVVAILALIAGLLLPSLAKSKAKAQSITALNNLKQIGLAARMWANDHDGRFPPDLETLRGELSSDKVLIDPSTGQRFLYVGAGKSPGDSEAILAYSPDGRFVSLADGSVDQLNQAEFAQAIERDAFALSQGGAQQILTPQVEALQRQQLANNQPAPTAPPPPSLQPPPPSASPAAPTASGIRSIRIDVPKAGRPVHFTKVLNVREEPLSIQMRAMRLRVYRVWRSSWQLFFFLAGLVLLWRHGRRPVPSSLWTTTGAVLAMGSVVSLLLTLRALHLALIFAGPILLFVFLLWLFRRLWARHQESRPATTAAVAGGPGPSPTPPTVPGILLICSLALGLGQAGSSHAATPKTRTVSQPEITNAVSILSGAYVGNVLETVAQFEAVLQIATAATNQTIPLFQEDVAVQSFSAQAGPARLLRQGNYVAVWLGEAGQATLRFQLAARLGGDVTKRTLSFAIPPALASRIDLTLAEPDADVEFPTAVALERVTVNNQTRIQAILGAGAAVDLRWTPRMKRVAEVEASVFSQSTTLVTLGGGVVNTRTVLDYQIVQGELRQLKVQLPAGQRLLRVEGPLIRTWEIVEEAGQSRLQVELVKGVTDAYQLTVETESLLDALPAQVAVAVPHPMQVIRDTGLVGLQGSEEVGLAIQAAQGLQRVDPAEFAKSSQFKAESLASAYRFLRPDFQLTARAEAIQPQIEAVSHHAIRVGLDQTTLRAQVDFAIKKAGLFTLRLGLPEGFQVDQVDGTNILQWTEKNNPRLLEISLQKRTLGFFAVNLTLRRLHPNGELPATIPILSVHPLEVQKLTSYIAVTAEPGVALKTERFAGLTEIPAAALPSSRALQAIAAGQESGSLSSVLAFKCISLAAAPAPAWSLSVAAETLASWVRAEIVHFVSVSDTLVNGRALLRYEIQNAPLKGFVLRMPAAWKNVEIVGTDIRRRDQEGDQWRIELQNKVRGQYQLSVTWEEPRSARTNDLQVAGVEAVSAERETGYIVVLAKPPLQILESSASDELVRIDVRELPAWTGLDPASAPGAESPVLVYRYLRPDFQLGLAVERFAEAALLQALVDSGQLTSIVADDGQMMTEMKLAIRNNGLQHLKLELPPKADVWSAFVAGQPVRPIREGNQLMLPLAQPTSDDATVSVELTYVGTGRFPATKGTIEMTSPQLEVPLKNMRWDLYLPPDYAYSDFQGTMDHEISAAPEVKVYSQMEYSRQEERQKVARRSKLESSLRKARSQLAEGKLKGANFDLNQALALNTKEDLRANQELEQLQVDITRAQSSNLLQAQRDYTLDNVTRYGQEGGAQVPVQQRQAQGKPGAGQAAQAIQYDEKAAEQQWRALARAQAVTVTRVQPLRVNLPTRGVPHAFTQALQTEAGQPMTIQFHAASTRQISWFKRLVSLAGVFGLLWILVSLVLKRPRRPRMDR